jgi:hypothetical protein
MGHFDLAALDKSCRPKRRSKRSSCEMQGQAQIEAQETPFANTRSNGNRVRTVPREPSNRQGVVWLSSLFRNENREAGVGIGFHPTASCQPFAASIARLARKVKRGRNRKRDPLSR